MYERSKWGDCDWIIKSIGAPFAAMRGEVVISVRSTYYGVLHQRYIKPLPREQELDVTEREKELTNAKP